MKMSIDKKYVEDYQMERVKEDAKEFKGRYTDGDLLRSLMEQIKDYRCWASDIVYCNVKAIDSGWASGNVTMFCVEMMVENINRIYKLRFYIDMDLQVDVRPKMITIREFKEND